MKQLGSFYIVLLAVICQVLFSQNVLADAALPRISEVNHEPPLFMHAKTFTNAPSTELSRNHIEMEVTKTVQCQANQPVDEFQLYQSLRGDNRAPYKLFRKLSQCTACEALASGFPFDEMPWDQKSHEIREALPYVWLSIENSRFVPDKDSLRELDTDLDLMDDWYFDTEDYLALDNDFVVRGRKRWGPWRPKDAPRLRRMLIAVKKAYGTDPLTGLKKAHKFDIRNSRDRKPRMEDLKLLIPEIQSGHSTWIDGTSENFPVRPIEPLKWLYQSLQKTTNLPSRGSYQQVLALQPKVFLRSMRSRFHYVETTMDKMRHFIFLGKRRLREFAVLAKKAKKKDALSVQLDTYLTNLKKLQNFSLILEQSEDELIQLDPNFGGDQAKYKVRSLVPWNTIDRTSDILDLKKRKVVAHTVKHIYDQMADQILEMRSLLLPPFNLVESNQDLMVFERWQKSQISNQVLGLNRKTTYDALIEIHDRMTKKKKIEESLVKLNQYGIESVAGFKPLNQERFKRIKDIMIDRQFDIMVRQIQAAGTAGLGLWFDRARAFYVPSSRRVDEEREFDDFMIDTMDFTTIYDQTAWRGRDMSEQNNQFEPNQEAFVGISLVNEIQIELGKESPYLDRVKKLKDLLNQAPESKKSALKDQLVGAEFILSQYKDSLSYLADIKGSQIKSHLDQIKKSGCRAWLWTNANQSKGADALGRIRSVR